MSQDLAAAGPRRDAPPTRRRRDGDRACCQRWELSFVLALALAPAGALAAEVYSEWGAIVYEAGPGEANDVVVTQEAGNIVLTDTGAGVTLTDTDGAGGCEVAGTVATCPGAEVYWVDVDVADGDDEISVDGAIPVILDLDGGDGDDTVSGGVYADYVYGGAGDDLISGGGGDDFLDDGAGDDKVDAGDGADRFYGRAGDDVFNGGPGNDVFNGIDSTGADEFNGGSGNDWLDYRRTRPLTVSLDGVADDGEGSARAPTARTTTPAPTSRASAAAARTTR